MGEAGARHLGKGEASENARAEKKEREALSFRRFSERFVEEKKGAKKKTLPLPTSFLSVSEIQHAPRGELFLSSPLLFILQE